MNDTTNPARRLRHGDRPAAPLRWNDRWTLLLTGPHHGMIGPLGSTWPNQSAEYERVDVCVLREDFPVAVFRRGGEGAGSWHKLELISHGTPTDPLRDGEQLYRAGTVPKLESIEQYRMQMAAIGTASFGYWKEGDTIHPDYDTVPLRDVARLFAKYDHLYKFREQVRVMVAMLKNREWAEDLAATGDAAELQAVITELVGKLAAASNWISTGPHGDNCFVSDHHEGDPGNRCNCGKDSLLEYLESDAEKTRMAGSAKGGNTNAESSDLAPTTSTVSASGNSSKNSSSSEGDQAAPDDVRNQALEDAKEASEILESFIDNVSTDGPYGAEATLTFIGQAKQCVDGAIHALITTAAQAATDKSED